VRLVGTEINGLVRRNLSLWRMIGRWMIVPVRVATPTTHWKAVASPAGTSPGQVQLRIQAPRHLRDGRPRYPVRGIVEEAVGQVSRNEYFDVNAQNAIGVTSVPAAAAS